MFELKPDPWFEDGRKKAVYAGEAMIVSPNPQAAMAGYDMLRAGGSAMDAAIAAMAMTSVVEASQAGPGGDCFALVHDPRGGLRAYNGSGAAPSALSADYLLAQGFAEVPRVSPHSVTIPGAVEAWCRLHADYGRLERARVFAPAIEAAEAGVVLHPRIVRDWHAALPDLRAQPLAARHFLKDGAAPPLGARWRLPGYAALFREIVREGATAFYESAFAERLVGQLRALGGLHSLEDFAGHRGEYVEPVTTQAHGQTFAECPPNGQGAAALILIRLLEAALKGGSLDSALGHHILAEASKIAFALRDDLIADGNPDAASLDALLSDASIARLSAGILPDRAARRLRARDYVPHHKDTSYVSVVDRDGLTVSLISSIYTDFGSTLCEAETGVILQNRGAGFALAEGHPNRLAGGRRPMHTIIPAMALKGGQPMLSFGVTGGHYQPVGHAVLAQAIFGEQMDPQEALNLPRSQCQDSVLMVEAVLGEAQRRDLAARGHEVAVSGHPLGGGHAIRIDHERGVLVGGSDSRRDGLVIGY
ncbi:gamma-glutamyltransferase family protein [Propylenella binzhouense]|uniref:Gamma-glutamyltransferase family protein n=1 Tax=Propylenella binzhouense TaxID=2555902 RepID=A0A964T0N2_9HYPH|nr:gamma-glutamyltransferase family protein [Propylenella binzhouense]MYZ46241.1 gamma-glutamyltransferase family protein [Propylenella binzhouense]